ncbi:MAG: Pr6Pr family membrane protein [Treponema sp.]|jgi:hypothetical protein|nr:Pr6Pr family membrane protein [Treponema sp.]
MEEKSEKNILNEKWREVARIIFNAILVICAGIGTFLTVIELGMAMTLSAFTIQSNLLCLIMSSVTLIRQVLKRNSDNRLYTFFKGMALLSILLTFIVYNFVLKPYFNTTQVQNATLANNLQHIIVPLMTVADYFLFEKKGMYTMWHPFAWTAFPLYYVGYTAIYKAFGGMYKFSGNTVAKFPYFFLDYETFGLKTVGIWVLLIVIGFIGSSYLLVGLDRILVKVQKR